MSDILKQISEKLRTQDDQMTRDPMFCVQVQRRMYGMDPKLFR